MQYTVDEINGILHEKVYAIRDIFNGFFGEGHVDLQDTTEPARMRKYIEKYLFAGVGMEATGDHGYELDDGKLGNVISHFHDMRASIIVWWPNVTVTNENGHSINIQDLYARIVVTMDGKIPYECYGFLLNRATYTQEQFLSDYMQSHVKGIPKDDFTHFQQPCLGTGPIRNTIMTLMNENDEASWMLFCQELGMYVTVESLKGIPYKYLEEIGKSKRVSEYYGYSSYGSNAPFLKLFPRNTLMEFIQHYLTNGHLSLSFRNGEYQCGMPYYEYIIDISNSFIDFYNRRLKDTQATPDRLFDEGLLRNVIVSNGDFFSKGDPRDSSRLDLARYEGKHVLTFKGEDIRTHIILDYDQEETKVSILVCQNFAMYVLNNILRTINYRYRNGKDNRGKDTAPASQRVIYL